MPEFKFIIGPDGKQKVVRMKPKESSVETLIKNVSGQEYCAHCQNTGSIEADMGARPFCHGCEIGRGAEETQKGTYNPKPRWSRPPEPPEDGWTPKKN
ncbi:MAG: hypothetical protein NTW98_03335 [Candidatus Nomurabacteria bacterium]|nr:hypothetical protein [Candidatus Nomurabacteria bacterium]